MSTVEDKDCRRIKISLHQKKDLQRRCNLGRKMKKLEINQENLQSDCFYNFDYDVFFDDEIEDFIFSEKKVPPSQV